MRTSVKWGLWAVVALLTLVTVAVVRFFLPLPEVPLRVSTETTFLTEPLREDRTVDYLEALRREMSDGVTTDNNALRPLLEAVGPDCFGDDVRDTILERVSLQDLPAQGPFLTVPPWTLDDEDGEKTSPPAAEREAWFREHEERIELVVAASNRSRFYVPLVTAADPPYLLHVRVPRLRELVPSWTNLLERARWRLESGDSPGAWSDALATLRLGCLLGQDWTQVYGVAGAELRRRGSRLAAEVVRSESLGVGEIESRLSTLLSLPRHLRIRDRVRIERMLSLDAASYVFWEVEVTPAYAPSDRRRAIDSNVFFGEIQRAYDDLDDALSGSTACERSRELEETTRAWQVRMEDEVEGSGSLAFWWDVLVAGPASARERISRLQALQVLAITLPSFSKSQSLEARADARLALLRLSLSLAAYRADHETFPEGLDDLVPGYLEVVPQDLFVGAPFVYRRTPDGYTLYSLGLDGEDDGGDPERDIVFGD